MKVLLITAFAPTPHNIGGPSALTYYLAKYSKLKIDLVYYSKDSKKEIFYSNEMHDVFAEIIKLKKKIILAAILKLLDYFNIKHRFFGSSYTLIPSKRIIKKINNKKYDLIWIYPCTMQSWERLIENNNIVLTAPDCSLLHFELVEKIYGLNKEARKLLSNNVNIKHLDRLKHQAFVRETKWSNSKTLIHVVGKDDKKRYDELGAKEHCFYSPHPFYNCINIKEPLNPEIQKSTILITGENQSIYIGDFLDRIVNLIIQNKGLINKYRFSFLGKNFDEVTNLLINEGFEVTSKSWVDNYEFEISNAQIQLFPIILGTGTKGKVLTALASGLLCLGTDFAFENIEVSRQNIIVINNEIDVIKELNKIHLDKIHYSNLAHDASIQVRNNHKPQKAANLFWNEISNYFEFPNVFNSDFLKLSDK